MGARPMANLSHPAAMVAPPQTVHSATHTGSTGRPVAHSVAGGMHSVAPRNGARPVVGYGTTRVRTTHPTTSVRYNPTMLPGPTAEDSYGTPGLGFDYAHFAAVHPYFGRRRDRVGSVVPFFGGGIYLPSAGYIDSGASADSADQEAADAAAQGSDTTEASAVDQAPMVTRTRPSSNNSVPASPEYIFVRRDGTVFFAVAYSWANGNLQYVTQDGLRKLAALNTLDLDATAQFNEQRGVAFRSPA
jgi:hypothetical protein